MGRRIADWLLGSALVVALVSAIVALWAASRWPLVGDAALMRYVVLLLHAGRAPYRQIVDINLPGSYLLEACAMSVFGAGAVGLRLYDGFLCLVACAGAAALAGRGWRARSCGLIAGLLFVTIHLRDGLVQAGERDLAMAVIVLVAYCALLRWPRGVSGVLLYELLIGLTLIVKPTLMPLALLPLLVRRLEPCKSVFSRRAVALAALVLLLPALAMLLWLARFHALMASFDIVRHVVATHSALAHQNLLGLLTHAVQPMPIVFLLAAIVLFRLRVVGVEDKLLLAGVFCGLLSFLAQEKGFPYQRYPFLLLSLVLIARLLATALESEGLNRVVATATVALIGFWLLPSFAAAVRTYESLDPTGMALAQDLSARHVSSGTVQCLDTVGGCIGTLYKLRLVQSTGFLYDCYAYEGSEQEQTRYRNELLAAMTAARPRTLILTDQFCLGEKPRLRRVEDWPELSAWLTQNYRSDGGWQPTQTVRWWHQPERPPGYALYALK